MDTFDAIQSRRSVKHFDPNHVFSETEMQQLLAAAILSPTSFNMQNWRFVWVRDSTKRQAIRAAAWNQAQVTDASALLVLCADLQAHAREPQRYWKDAPEPVREMIVPMIAKFYDNQAQLQRDEAMRSIGIVAQTIMLAARAMGYDSNPMIGFDPAVVAGIIGLPEDHVIGLVIAIGKAIKPAMPRAGQLPLNEVLFIDGFGHP
jgi:nitroreductase